MNQITLIGRMGQDPKPSQTNGGVDTARFSVATRGSRKVNGEYPTEWFNCQAFGASAQFVNQYLGKGSLVCVIGELSSYEDKNGVTRYSVAASRVQGLGESKRPQIKGGPKQGYDAPETAAMSEDDVPW